MLQRCKNGKLTHKHDAGCCDRSPLPPNLVDDQAQADHASKEPCHLGVVQGMQEGLWAADAILQTVMSCSVMWP